MANTSCAKKAARQAETRTLRNKSNKSYIKTLAKNALNCETREAAIAGYKTFEKEVMKRVSKNIFHLNTAARKVSRLYSAINKKFAAN